MVLITGGAYSGLEEFAIEYERKYADKIQNDQKKMQTIYIHQILVDYHNEIESLELFLQRWVEEKKAEFSELILIHEEMGCGLIPDVRQKREQREKQGRAGCFFGERAEEVYRVCCGLGIKIK